MGASTTQPDATTKNANAFYCITTHNPRNLPIRDIINTNWDILQKTKTTRDIFESKIIFGLRRNKNLSDHLVRASTKTNTPRETFISTHPCKRPGLCRYCPKINHSGEIISKTTGQKVITMKNTNCQSSNIIYLITCTTCGIQYVGQTKLGFRVIILTSRVTMIPLCHDISTNAPPPTPPLSAV